MGQFDYASSASNAPSGFDPQPSSVGIVGMSRIERMAGLDRGEVRSRRLELVSH